MQATAIARHLNIAESAILRIEEWANVLFVVCRKLGARFVSKKVVKVERQNWQSDPRYGFAETAKSNQSGQLDRLMTEIGWMVDRDTMKRGGKWTTFKLNGDYYPRDINESLANAKQAGFAVFHSKQQGVIGVLSEQI